MNDDSNRVTPEQNNIDIPVGSRWQYIGKSSLPENERICPPNSVYVILRNDVMSKTVTDIRNWVPGCILYELETKHEGVRSWPFLRTKHDFMARFERVPTQAMGAMMDDSPEPKESIYRSDILDLAQEELNAREDSGIVAIGMGYAGTLHIHVLTNKHAEQIPKTFHGRPVEVRVTGPVYPA